MGDGCKSVEGVGKVTNSCVGEMVWIDISNSVQKLFEDNGLVVCIKSII